MTVSHFNAAYISYFSLPTMKKVSTPVILSFFLAPGWWLRCGGHALGDLFLSLSHQGVEMLAELWLDNLYVYQVIITPEIGNCPPDVVTQPAGSEQCC